MKTLKDIYTKYSTPEGKGDKGTAHSYIDLYEKYIVPKKDCSLFEIGVCEGHSIAMWKEFLPDADIWGIDINTSSIKFDLQNCTIIRGDATSENLGPFLGDKRFDYIIDDGSHLLDHQVRSFELLFPFLKDDGLYFIEDITLVNANMLKSFLDSKKVRYECHNFIEKSNRSDDILFLIHKQ